MLFRSTLNTDATLSLLPSMLKGNVCLSVTKFATSIEGNHHLEIYHATLYSLLFPLYLFSFYRATIKRRRMKSWLRAFLSETSSPPSSDRTRKSSSPSVPIFSFSFLFFFPLGNLQCRWQIFTVTVGIERRRGGGISIPGRISSFSTTNEPRRTSWNRATKRG